MLGKLVRYVDSVLAIYLKHNIDLIVEMIFPHYFYTLKLRKYEKMPFINSFWTI